MRYSTGVLAWSEGELSPAPFPKVILTRDKLVWLLGLSLFLCQVERVIR